MKLRNLPHLFEITRDATVRLTTAGVDNSMLDARLLIAEALHSDCAQLLTQPDRILTPEEAARIESYINRRAAREPVARILGLREFWGLPFGLNESTLEPRPDSETLIDVALPFKPQTILDLGTGSGCLLLALLHELPQATGIGIDIAPRAIEQAQQNAARLELQHRASFHVGDWFTGIAEKFDLIISNPPYIVAAEISELMPEVRDHDPIMALDGGADGLDAYRHLIPQLSSHLNSNAHIVFEVGEGQAFMVRDLLQQSGFDTVNIHEDLAGVERSVCGIWPL